VNSSPEVATSLFTLRRRQWLRWGLLAGFGVGAFRSATAQTVPEASVPMRLQRTGDVGALPSIELVIDGTTTHWLVDSGSTTALVAPALAERLRLRRLPPVSVATAGGLQTVDRYELPALPWPGGEAGTTVAAAIDLDALFGPAGARIDGLIGAPWLRDGVTTFDFARGQLRRGRTIAPPPGAVTLPLRWDGPLPVLRLAIGSRPAEDFLFDTGNAGALVVFARRARALLAEAGELPGITVHELGGTASARHVRIERLAAADLVWTEVPAALQTGAAAVRGGHFDRLAGSVGCALFEAGAVTLDGRAGRLVVEAPGLPTPPPLPGGFGLTLGRVDSAGLVVSAVFDGGPASMVGIVVSDRVTAIDGNATGAWTPADAWQALAGRGAADFEIARAGSTARRLRLQRQRFFPLLR